MDARDQLRDKFNRQHRDAEQERRWGQIFVRLLLIWASVFVTAYFMLPADTALGAWVTVFAAGLSVVTALAAFFSRKR